MMDDTKITPETSMLLLLAKYPDTAQVLIRRNMACIGCDMSAFETIASAAEVYGINLEDLMNELRSVSESSMENGGSPAS